MYEEQEQNPLLPAQRVPQLCMEAVRMCRIDLGAVTASMNHLSTHLQSIYHVELSCHKEGQQGRGILDLAHTSIVIASGGVQTISPCNIAKRT